MKTLLLTFLLAIALPAAARDLIVAVGRDGEPAYGPIFRKQAEAWTNAGKQAGKQVGLDASGPLAGSVLSAQTWRQALNVVTSRGQAKGPARRAS